MELVRMRVKAAEVDPLSRLVERDRERRSRLSAVAVGAGLSARQIPNRSGFQVKPSSDGGAMYPTSADAATTAGLAR